MSHTIDDFKPQRYETRQEWFQRFNETILLMAEFNKRLADNIVENTGFDTFREFLNGVLKLARRIDRMYNVEWIQNMKMDRWMKNNQSDYKIDRNIRNYSFIEKYETDEDWADMVNMQLMSLVETMSNVFTREKHPTVKKEEFEMMLEQAKQLDYFYNIHGNKRLKIQNLMEN